MYSHPQRTLPSAGAIRGLDQPARASADRPITIDLKQPIEVRIHQQPISIGLLPRPSIEAVAEASQGTSVNSAITRMDTGRELLFCRDPGEKAFELRPFRLVEGEADRVVLLAPDARDLYPRFEPSPGQV
jgi:hypothetical protein